jgi:hypothetical protein
LLRSLNSENLAIRPSHPRRIAAAWHFVQPERASPKSATPGAVERGRTPENLRDGLIEAATARGDGMTSEQIDELIDGALTRIPSAIKNLIAGGISAKPCRSQDRRVAQIDGRLLRTGGSR